MEKEVRRSKKRSVLGFVRALLLAFVVTAVNVFLLGIVLYKVGLSHGLMLGGSIVIYILSCFMGGFVLGKGGRKKAFLWGLLLGTVYYMVLLLIALLVPRQDTADQWSVAINLGICALSGMTGAMLVKK